MSVILSMPPFKTYRQTFTYILMEGRNGDQKCLKPAGIKFYIAIKILNA